MTNINMKASKNDKTYTCQSCGAIFLDTEVKCPYCGTTNLKGAKIEYYNKLDNIREDLSELANTDHEIKKTIRSGGKLAIIVTIIIISIVAFGFISNKLLDVALFSNGASQEENIIWSRNTFPIWDDLYSKGEYDQLITLIKEEKAKGYNTYNWVHLSFINKYEDFLEYKEYADRIVDGDMLSRYEFSVFLDCHIQMLNMDYMKNISDKEKEVLKEKFSNNIDISQLYGITEEEIKLFNEEFQKRGYVSYEKYKAILDRLYD